MGEVCECGHGPRLHTDERPDGAVPCECLWDGCGCPAYKKARPDVWNRAQSRALLKGREDLAHAITAATRAGALITIGPFGGGDDSAIRVAIDYRQTLITGTMVDPFEALALALAQWVRVHG